ncbi:hypothetical protein [Azospirillum sp. sgz301742]
MMDKNIAPAPENSAILEKIDRAYRENFDLAGALLIVVVMCAIASNIDQNIVSLFWRLVDYVHDAHIRRDFWHLIFIPPGIGLLFFVAKKAMPLSYGTIEVILGTIITDSSAFHLAENGGRTVFFENVKDTLGLITALFGGVYIVVRGLESIIKGASKDANKYGFIPEVRALVRAHLDDRRKSAQ